MTYPIKKDIVFFDELEDLAGGIATGQINYTTVQNLASTTDPELKSFKINSATLFEP